MNCKYFVSLALIGNIGKDVSSGTRLKRSFAVAASDESVDKPKRCISKLERRKLVEEFVNRFVASNAGKFPKVSHVRKVTGGSFYVIREIVQELQYNHKMSLQKSEKLVEATERNDVTELSCNLNTDSGDRHIKDNEAVEQFEVEPVLNSSGSENALEEELKCSPSTEISCKSKSSCKLGAGSEYSQAEDAETTGFEVKPLLSSSDSEIAFREELICSSSIHSNENIIEEVKKYSIDKQNDSSDKIQYENLTSQESSTIRVMDIRSSVSIKIGVKQSSDKVSKSDSNNSIALKEEADSQKGSNIWTSLKSLADGIVNFWKNH